MRRLILCSLVLASLAGCQRLSWSATNPDLGPKGVATYEFSAPAYEQRVTVSVKPDDAAVSAYLVKESDKDAVAKILDAISSEPPANLVLGSRASEGEPETYSFDATVPAKVPYVLFLRGGKKTTSVNVTVTGK